MAQAGSTDIGVAEKLNALKRAFKQQLSAKFVDIQTLCTALERNTISHDQFLELHRLVHSLAGSAGTFGAIAVGSMARELEVMIKPLALSESAPTPEIIQRINEVLSRLNKASEEWDAEQSLLFPEKHSYKHESEGAELVYLLEDDELLATEIVAKLEGENSYRVKHFADEESFLTAAVNEPPQVILMDMILGDTRNSGANVIHSLSEKVDELPPVIFISVRTDMQARLDAARVGARRYFTKPLDMEKLADTLDGLTTRRASQSYRILLVDDDKTLLDYYCTVLGNLGMDVRATSNPMLALEILEEFIPDMMVVDVYMPICSGPELAQVVRQDDKFAQMPIMFLSTETDLDRQLAAMHLGGDDFLTKPVEVNHFVEAVIARVKRSRWVRHLNSNLEHALRESEYRHITLDQHAIVSTTDINGKIIFANDKFCEVSGYSKQELIGKNHNILRSDVHDQAFYSELWSTISKGKVWNGVICNRSKDGKKYWVSSTIVPFLDAEGKPYQYMAARTDITQMKESEENAIRAQRKLEAQQALLVEAKDRAEKASRAKSHFLSSMSHELRTPLNAILGFSQLMLLDNTPPLSEQQKANLKEIDAAGHHLLELINDVLDLAMIESGGIQMSIVNIELAELLTECVNLVQPLIKKRGITLSVSHGKTPVDIQHLRALGCVCADRIRLKQVVLNLLSNAIKYNRDEGYIEIDLQQQGGSTLIAFKDTGIGINEDKLSDLFEPFNRLGEEQGNIEGTGIGLVISKNLVEHMGGRFGVKSHEGEGSTFWIEFPVLRTTSDQPLPEPENDTA